MVDQPEDIAKKIEAFEAALSQDMELLAFDRELIECPQCGCHEDVTLEGKILILLKDKKVLEEHSFSAIDDMPMFFKCPHCSTIIQSKALEE
jgi:hypothetical protein